MDRDCADGASNRAQRMHELDGLRGSSMGHDVLTDLNLTLSTFHRFDMNSSKSWSSASNRHWKA